MKKYFLLIILLLSVRSAWGQPVDIWGLPVEVNGIMYNLNDDLQEKKARVTNKQVINGYWSQKEYVGNLVIPSTITVDEEVYTVTNIDWECFTPSKNLTSVTIPSTVKSLAYGAFRDCTGLKSVTLPNTLESLEQFCFENCI